MLVRQTKAHFKCLHLCSIPSAPWRRCSSSPIPQWRTAFGPPSRRASLRGGACPAYHAHSAPAAGRHRSLLSPEGSESITSEKCEWFCWINFLYTWRIGFHLFSDPILWYKLSEIVLKHAVTVPMMFINIIEILLVYLFKDTWYWISIGYQSNWWFNNGLCAFK